MHFIKLPDLEWMEVKLLEFFAMSSFLLIINECFHVSITTNYQLQWNY